jgi:hypothetical protein
MMNTNLIETPLLIGVIDSRDSWQACFISRGKWLHT